MFGAVRGSAEVPRCSTKTSTCAANARCRVLASEVRFSAEYKKPELTAMAPNQVSSWDITRLLEPKKSSYYGNATSSWSSTAATSWAGSVADRENSALDRPVDPADASSSMVSSPEAQTAALGSGSSNDDPMHSLIPSVTRSLSRPQVSDDFPRLSQNLELPSRRRGDQGQAKTFCRSSSAGTMPSTAMAASRWSTGNADSVEPAVALHKGEGI